MIEVVVSQCPVCNAPIYGPRRIDNGTWTSNSGWNGTRLPARFRCDCRIHLVARIQAETAEIWARINPPSSETGK